MKQEIRQFLSKIGKRGGKSGIGEAKRRGDSEYYSRIGKMRKKK